MQHRGRLLAGLLVGLLVGLCIRFVLTRLQGLAARTERATGLGTTSTRQ
jgi:hypothetical protein